MEDINITLDKLSKSKFRSSFYLNKKMKLYVSLKGLSLVREHAYEIINKRLKPAIILNDGKQTPMQQVHPVFIAQHACACCCRNCLFKWHKIPKGKELTDEEINYIVELIMRWISREVGDFYR